MHWLPVLFLLCISLTSCRSSSVHRDSELDSLHQDKKLIGVLSNFKKRRPTNAILHLFNYRFVEIEELLQEIADIGYAWIQISPVQASFGKEWYMRYQPLDYRILESPLGTERELKKLINRAKRLKIRIIADLVLNHMAGPGADGPLFYPPVKLRIKHNVGLLFNKDHFYKAFCLRGDDWLKPEVIFKGRLCGDPSEDNIGLPTLIKEDPYVLKVQRNYMTKLKRLGIKGFRFDAMKHAPPDYFANLLKGGRFNDMLLFGEIIAMSPQEIETFLNPYVDKLNRMKFMDFPLLNQMVGAVRPGGQFKILEWPESSFSGPLPKDRSISFVVNHDIPTNSIFRDLILDPVDEEMMYTYLLGRKQGQPQIYSDLGFEDSSLPIIDNQRWKHYFKRSDMVAKVRFHNFVFKEEFKPIWVNECVIVFGRGKKAFVAINKCDYPQNLPVPSDIKPGFYIDVLTEKIYSTVDKSGQILIDIPGRTSQMFIFVR